MSDFLTYFRDSFKKGWEAPDFGTQSVRSRPSLWHPFRTWREEEERELVTLYTNVRAAFLESPYAQDEPRERITHSIISDALENSNCHPGHDLLGALINLVDGLLIVECFHCIDMGHGDWVSQMDMREAQYFKNYLERRQRYYVPSSSLIDTCRSSITQLLSAIFDTLPEDICTGKEMGNTPRIRFDVAVIERLERPITTIEQIAGTMFDKALLEADVFGFFRDEIRHNILVASGLDPDDPKSLDGTIILPSQTTGKSLMDLVTSYLGNTPFATFLSTSIPFCIPDAARFEHCHIIGGTGHGKTQCLQYLISADLARAQNENLSVVVIDSQGDMIQKLSRSTQFALGAPHSLSQQYILIDPSDIEHPPALNLFDLGLERLAAYAPRQRELAFNSLVDIYGRFFGSLLGAELTARQNTVFRYLARLMLTIKGATIHTLIELMDDIGPFRDHIADLEPTARRFFEKEFDSPSFRATRGQIKQRLYAVLSIPTFDRLFSAKESRINFFDALNEGKIIFVNTAKDLLKQDGTEIFGRFILALVEHAVMERATVPVEDRNPVFLYIDEAQDYFDDTVETLLVQARKYNCGLTLAHQTLAQLTPRLRAVFASNTTIKLAGGLSDSDARAMAADMRTTADFLLSMKKRGRVSDFALSVRNLTTQALKIGIPLGFLEGNPVLELEQCNALLHHNRLQIGYTPVNESTPTDDIHPETAQPPPSPPLQNEKQAVARSHREIQETIKLTAQQLGFSASIETPVLNGKGRIDVAIQSPHLRIACEISVTTRAGHEQHNVEKCMAAGFDEVWVISPDSSQLQKLKENLARSLSTTALEATSFLSEPDALERLNTLAEMFPAQQTTFMGYDVSLVLVPTGHTKATEHRERLASIEAALQRGSP